MGRQLGQELHALVPASTRRRHDQERRSGGPRKGSGRAVRDRLGPEERDADAVSCSARHLIDGHRDHVAGGEASPRRTECTPRGDEVKATRLAKARAECMKDADGLRLDDDGESPARRSESPRGAERRKLPVARVGRGEDDRAALGGLMKRDGEVVVQDDVLADGGISLLGGLAGEPEELEDPRAEPPVHRRGRASGIAHVRPTHGRLDGGAPDAEDGAGEPAEDGACARERLPREERDDAGEQVQRKPAGRRAV